MKELSERDALFSRKALNAACCAVIDIDYRVSPVCMFPVALLANESREFLLACQILDYPVLDFNTDPGAKRASSGNMGVEVTAKHFLGSSHGFTVSCTAGYEEAEGLYFSVLKKAFHR